MLILRFKTNDKIFINKDLILEKMDGNKLAIHGSKEKYNIVREKLIKKDLTNKK